MIDTHEYSAECPCFKCQNKGWDMAKSELAPARGSAEFLYCKDCIHSCAMMQVPTYHPDAWCYMFRESQRDSINAQGYCGQKRLNPIVPPIPTNFE